MDDPYALTLYQHKLLVVDGWTFVRDDALAIWRLEGREKEINALFRADKLRFVQKKLEKEGRYEELAMLGTLQTWEK